MFAPTVEVTWETLAKIEPRLVALLAEVKAQRPRRGKTYCANAVWYAKDSFRARLIMLVGWGAKHAAGVIRTSEAYDVAYRKLYDALPHCRRCGCL